MQTPASFLKKLTIAIFMAALTSGCSTTLSKMNYGMGHPYGGARELPEHFKCAMSWYGISFITIPMIIIDTPLSLALDTLLLPADLVLLKSQPMGSTRCPGG